MKVKGINLRIRWMHLVYSSGWEKTQLHLKSRRFIVIETCHRGTLIFSFEKDTVYITFTCWEKADHQISSPKPMAFAVNPPPLFRWFWPRCKNGPRAEGYSNFQKAQGPCSRASQLSIRWVSVESDASRTRRGFRDHLVQLLSHKPKPHNSLFYVILYTSIRWNSLHPQAPHYRWRNGCPGALSGSFKVTLLVRNRGAAKRGSPDSCPCPFLLCTPFTHKYT